MNAAIAQMEISLDVLITNEPINRAAGNTEQADLEAVNAAEIRQALDFLRGDSTRLPSRFQIGDRVKVFGAYGARVESVRFTDLKVRYDVFLDVLNSKVENVDSFYVTEVEIPEPKGSEGKS